MTIDSPLIDTDDRAALLAEIARLRAEVALLRGQCGELDHLAHHDALVPLPNRRGFDRQLDALIDRATRHGEGGALLFIDVDNLKTLNDSFGHDAGDAALVEVAAILTRGTRQSDCVARYGGDEFAVLLARVDLDQANETALRLADRIAEADFHFQGRRIPLSAAIGLSEIRANDTPEAVIARADEAMYAKKVAA